MAKVSVAQCSIYDRRPDMCKEYPTIDYYIPPECGYFFVGSERRGKCDCGIAACCSIPRKGGEPEGIPMPEEEGGLPCKYVVWIEEEREDLEKKASVICDSKIGYAFLKDSIGD